MEQDSIDVLIVHFLRAFFEDSFDCVMIVLLKGHRTLLHESASILHLPLCLPQAPLRIYSASIRVRGRMPNVSDGVAVSSLVSCPLKTPHGQGRCWNFFSESIYLGCSKKWYQLALQLTKLWLLELSGSDVGDVRGQGLGNVCVCSSRCLLLRMAPWIVRGSSWSDLAWVLEHFSWHFLERANTWCQVRMSCLDSCQGGAECSRDELPEAVLFSS